MTFAPAIIAVDAGQSSIRARLLRGNSIEFQQDFAALLTDLPLLPQLVNVVRAMADGRALQDVRVAAAMSGLTSSDANPKGVLLACQDLGISEVHLTHDSISGYLGCLGELRGSAIAAGTGVVTLATGADSYARVDGWGNIMGDAGSGYWIGRAGLDAAMRAHDGRGEPTAILGLLHNVSLMSRLRTSRSSPIRSGSPSLLPTPGKSSTSLNTTWYRHGSWTMPQTNSLCQ